MADQPQKVLQAPPATVDEESARVRPKGCCRKKWVIVSVCIAASFAVQLILSVVFELTLLRVRRPSYLLQSVTVENLRVSNGTAPPSFNMQLNAQVTLTNRNYGSYKFHHGYLTFSYRGTPVGEVEMNKTSIKFRSTRTLGIMLNVTSEAASRNPSLGKDIASGLVPMTANSDLRGQVRFFKVYPRSRSTNMNCDLTINLVKKVVQDIRCD